MDDQPIGILKNPRTVSRVTKAVAGMVAEYAKNGALPVTLGGDHSLVCVVPINHGSLNNDPIHRQWELSPEHWSKLLLLLENVNIKIYFRAFPNACVVWVDAHADINTIETTETGRSTFF